MTDDEDRNAVIDKLQVLAQPDVEPTLSMVEVEDILDRHKTASRWVANTLFTFGTKVAPTTRNGHWYTVDDEGTTGSTEPTWPTGLEGSVADGTATFKESGIDRASVYDLRGAIRECWQLKAAKASEMISTQDSGSEQMIFEHCRSMADRYVTPMVL